MQTYRLGAPLTAAALSLLLAACGSGSDGSDSSLRTVSSSPRAPISGTAGTTTDSTAATGATSTTDAGTTTTGSAGTTDTVAESGTNTSASTGSASARAANSAANNGSASTAAALISSAGVRGDVLMTMLDQVPCNQDPSETSAVDGPAYPRSQNEVSDAKIQFSLDPSTYKANPDFKWPPNGAIFLSRPCNAFLYQPAKPGTYTLNVASYAFSRTQPMKLNKGFNNIALTPQLIVTASGASLSANMAASAQRDRNPYPENVQATLKPENEDATLKADSAFAFKLSDTVAFTNVLKQWRSGQSTVQLMLLPGQTDQAKLCWNINMQIVKRLQCQVWQVPANWKRGQELKEVDQYVVDDRTVYPNESGARYFRTGVQQQP
mgnify:CR=1 FL=1